MSEPIRQYDRFKALYRGRDADRDGALQVEYHDELVRFGKQGCFVFMLDDGVRRKSIEVMRDEVDRMVDFLCNMTNHEDGEE